MPEENSWLISEDTHKAIVHAAIDRFGVSRALSYELDHEGKLHARYGKGINPCDSFYYNGRVPDSGEIFDVAVKEKKELIILAPQSDSRFDIERVETHHKNEPFAVIPIEVDCKVILLISINFDEAEGNLFCPLEIAKFKHLVYKLILNQEAKGENILDKKLPEYLDGIEKIQIGMLLRNMADLGVKDLRQKALLAYLTVKAQNKKGVFPYNRFLKNGSRTLSKIISPDEGKEKDCIVWCNNHYLGLNRNKEVIRYAKQILEEYGSGCGTSAASGGFSEIHKLLESEVAKFTRRESVILYPTGYTANTGAIGTLASPGDMIIVDRDSHASMIDGIKMSGAEFRVFKHLDTDHLESILKKIDQNEYNNVFVLTESVFSMSGEEAPLQEICRLKQTHDFFLYVDEAHAFGFYGEKGSGLCEQTGQSHNVDFMMSTLSKATASIGGFIACDRQYSSYLRINSNPYLFQACLTPVDAAVNIAALKIIQSDKLPMTRLWKHTNKLRNLLINNGFNVGGSRSPIVPVYISEEEKLALFCRELYLNGIFTNWISYPAVRKRMGRLRFVVTANHTDEQIEKTVDVLRDLGKRLEVI